MTTQATPSDAPAFPSDFLSRVSYLLTGRPMPDAERSTAPAVDYTVCEEDDGYYD